jgi:hypothetical protein
VGRSPTINKEEGRRQAKADEEFYNFNLDVWIIVAHPCLVGRKEQTCRQGHLPRSTFSCSSVDQRNLSLLALTSDTLAHFSDLKASMPRFAGRLTYTVASATHF